MPILHLHPLPKLLLRNSNSLNRIQQEYNIGTSDSSYLKLEHLFLRYKPTQYNPIQDSDQPSHVLEPFQNKNNNSKEYTINSTENTKEAPLMSEWGFKYTLLK